MLLLRRRLLHNSRISINIKLNPTGVTYITGGTSKTGIKGNVNIVVRNGEELPVGVIIYDENGNEVEIISSSKISAGIKVRFNVPGDEYKTYSCVLVGEDGRVSEKYLLGPG